MVLAVLPKAETSLDTNNNQEKADSPVIPEITEIQSLAEVREGTVLVDQNTWLLSLLYLHRSSARKLGVVVALKIE